MEPGEPAAVLAAIAKMETEFVRLDERTRSYATSTQLVQAQRSIESSIAELLGAVKDMAGRVGVLEERSANMRENMASKAWVYCGIAGALLGCLGAVLGVAAQILLRAH
ncbi:MAG: hypothetical protein KGR99_16500 [Betaproteobacteria bacterium]|nr:hypothetical protein [Betaproteobacteria bacterium]MBU6513905.1 hypothetical protein [Betaproteobacteria bacterium]MDE2480256.1 hypothetical protein [Betaproteobacteria bacterium]